MKCNADGTHTPVHKHGAMGLPAPRVQEKGRDLRGGPRSGWTWLGGGYCRLQMLLKMGLAVRETVAGRRLGALEGEGGGGGNPPFPMHPCPAPGGLEGHPARQQHQGSHVPTRRLRAAAPLLDEIYRKWSPHQKPSK